MKIEIEVEGLEETQRALFELSQGFDRTSLMEAVGKAGVEMIRRRLREEKTSPSGKRWPDNLDGTELMIRSGGLYNSIYYEVDDESATIGTDWPYASIHNYGATIRSANLMKFYSSGRWWSVYQVSIPQREFMGWSDDNIRELEKVVEGHVDQWLEKWSK